MFKVRSNAIIHELLDHEIILADLDTGIYYSIRGIGIPIWQLLISGYPFQETMDLCARRYPHAPQFDLPSFVGQLLEETLLVPTQLQEPKMPPDLFWPEAFHPPLLEKHEEMKSLLMLDPIHEVDAQGWPMKGDFV